ncbi:MAG: MerR family transcriptional regulator [Myxococcales bacterium]|nr:MerR family transcriptional regulator [Myxococcales bacterium]
MQQRGTRYRIQAVAQMTGVPAPTLRAWERRYGVPSPERTASSYRLYSEDDVQLIIKLRELCNDGMSPAEAAKIVQRVTTRERAPERGEDDPFETIRERILDAVRRFDVFALERAIQRALLLGSGHSIYNLVLGPVMKTIGDLWHAGELSVAQEHMTSEVLGRTARDLLRLLQPEPPDGHAVLACFADEQHSFPLFGVAFQVTQWRLNPLILGARTPPTAIRHAVDELRPVFVGLSSTVELEPYRARELVEAYATACGDTPWILGGANRESLRAAVERAGGRVGGISELKSLIAVARRTQA